MPGYYPVAHREPVSSMTQVYPPARSHSLAKLNQAHPRDYGLYERVKVDRVTFAERLPQRTFEPLRRQQSYDGDVHYPRPMHHGFHPRRPEGFDSLQLLGSHNDDRYLDKFMDNSRGRTGSRDMVEPPKSSGKNTLLSTKSSNSKNSANANNSSKNNKENNKNNISVPSDIIALIGSLANSTSVDNIYESVEQIHYRKTLEALNRREKVRSVQRTGHPLFDRLREERALAGDSDTKNSNPIYSTNTLGSVNKRTSRSAGPSRKTHSTTSPAYSTNSSGDEQDKYPEGKCTRRSTNTLGYMSSQQQPRHSSSAPVLPTWRKGGSAGSESDDDWLIPRPKIGGRRIEHRTPSTDESDSSSKSSPMR